MFQVLEGIFSEVSEAHLASAIRILEAKFEALESTPYSSLDRSNFVKRKRTVSTDSSNNSDGSSNSSDKSNSSKFTNRTEEGANDELSPISKFEDLVECFLFRVSWEEFVRIINELDIEWDRDLFRGLDFIGGAESLPCSATNEQQTLAPCPATNEQHAFHKGMRCTLCNLQLCNSCAYCIADFIQAENDVSRYEALNMTRVSTICTVPGCGDKVPPIRWGGCICEGRTDPTAETRGNLKLYHCRTCVKYALPQFEGSFLAQNNGLGDQCECGSTPYWDDKCTERRNCRLCGNECEFYCTNNHIGEEEGDIHAWLPLGISATI